MTAINARKRECEEEFAIRTQRMVKARSSLEGAFAHIEALQPLSSLRDLPSRVRERSAFLRLAKCVRKCEELLAKKHLVMKEEEAFFPQREIADQQALLTFYQHDPDEIAAYLLTYEELEPGPLKIPLNVKDVYSWLLKRADALSFESAHALANYSGLDQDILVHVEDSVFCVNKLLAATNSYFFQKLVAKDGQEFEFEGTDPDAFSQIVDLIQQGTLPKQFSEEFLRLLDFFDFRESILQQVLDQLGLEFEGNVLLLEKPLPFLHHPFYRRMVPHVKLVTQTDEMLEYATTLELQSLEIKTQMEMENWGSILKKLKSTSLLKVRSYYGEPFLKELKCRVELIDTSNGDIQVAASFTQNLINYVIYEKQHFRLLSTFNQLQKLAIGVDVEPSFAVNPELKELSLWQGCPVGDETMQMLAAHFPFVRRLRISNGQLTKRGFKTLTSLPRLVALEINYSSFYLEGLDQIEHLTLLDGKLNRDDLEAICQLPRLKVVDVRRCKGLDWETILTVAEKGNLEEIKISDANADRWHLGQFFHKNLTSRTRVTY